MYRIIRCPGCLTFSYVDRYQQWKLCPRCGEAVNVQQATAYLEVEEYFMAEQIIRQLERFLDRSHKKDLSPDEIAALRQQYADWVRSRV
jgi:23S rRNA A2030 N6-methylase RlmJ